MRSQIQALDKRSEGYNSNIEKWRLSGHKVMNHCGRILYLAKLLSYGNINKVKELSPRLADNIIAGHYFNIKKITEKPTLCKTSNNACNIKNKNICKNLSENFVKAIFFYEKNPVERVEQFKKVAELYIKQKQRK